jgi:hypothetical protein
MRGQSTAVALKFNISFKTVKDIWQHKTWKHATYHLWPKVEISDNIVIKDNGTGAKVPFNVFVMTRFKIILVDGGNKQKYQYHDQRRRERWKGSFSLHGSIQNHTF